MIRILKHSHDTSIITRDSILMQSYKLDFAHLPIRQRKKYPTNTENNIKCIYLFMHHIKINGMIIITASTSHLDSFFEVRSVKETPL